MDQNDPSSRTVGGLSSVSVPQAQGWPRPLLVVALAVGVTLLLTLIRLAIDLLIVVGAIWAIGWSAGAISDWFEGERVPAWALGPMAGAVVVLVLLLEWVGGPRLLTPVIERHTPVAVTRALDAAAARGWGQVVLVPNLPFARTQPELTHARGVEVTLPGTGLPASGLPPVSLPRLGGGGARPRSGDATPGTSGVDAEAAGAASSHTSVRTTTTLDSVAAPMPGTILRLTATVTARSGETPEGSVRFRRGRALLGTVPVDAWGRASLDVRRIPAGTHEITAEFSGRGRFDDSTSAVLRHVTR